MELRSLVARLRQGDASALARAITLVENRDPEARSILASLFTETGTATIVGLTGPPGVGKSTLADGLAVVARDRGARVGILAIDPTSSISGGALLGDRARMGGGSGDASIFIRSMATRGHVGGLASAAFEALVLFEAAGKDFILLETVGAGQDEVEVAAAVDVTVLVLAPGLGDEVQAAKSGILEVADVLVVNKADREEARALAAELKAISGGRPVLETVATRGEGVPRLFEEVSRIASERSPAREGRLMEVWLWDAVRTSVRERIPESALESVLERMRRRKLSPYEAAEELLAAMKTKETS